MVDDVSLRVRSGETVGIVGESGAGKSLTALGAVALLPEGVRRTAGSARLLGRDLLGSTRRELRAIRGREIGMIFQDPLTSLHPSIRIGDQLVEGLRVHSPRVGRAAARDRVIELLERVHVAHAGERVDDFPHQWSGGMQQRAMIAMALMHDPALIIADEPTTALDVTIQAQILELLSEARRTTNAAAILISHDLGVIAEVADRVIVMYDGRIVEEAPVRAFFAAPRHPYSHGLLASVPTLRDRPGELSVIPGQPPDHTRPAPGCSFEPRCGVGHGDPTCLRAEPPLLGPRGHRVACHYPVDGKSP
ncbi:MAG: ABC transporter ATP-binding protein [Nocardioides sp.]